MFVPATCIVLLSSASWTLTAAALAKKEMNTEVPDIPGHNGPSLHSDSSGCLTSPSCSSSHSEDLPYSDTPAKRETLSASEDATASLCLQKLSYLELIKKSMESGKGPKITSSETEKFKDVLVRLLLSFEALAQSGRRSFVANEIVPRIHKIGNRSGVIELAPDHKLVIIELMIVNGCSFLLDTYQSLLHSMCRTFIELVRAPHVSCDQIFSLLQSRSSYTRCIDEIFKHSILTGRIALLNMILMLESHIPPQFLTRFKNIKISFDALTFAISQKELRDQPEVLAEVIKLFITHNLHLNYSCSMNNVSVTPFQLIPSTPLEMAVCFKCNVAIQLMVDAAKNNPQSSSAHTSLHNQMSEALFFTRDAHFFKWLCTISDLSPDLGTCRCGVSLWASAAFNADRELLYHFHEEGIPLSRSGEWCHPIIAAMLSGRDFAAILDTISFLINECSMSPNVTIRKAVLLELSPSLNLDKVNLNSQPLLSALDVAEMLFLKSPDAENFIRLIKEHGGLRAEDLSGQCIDEFVFVL
jgi:hypothetical protein